MPTVDCLVVTCEHGGNRIPAAYRPLFKGRKRLLDSHRGWDPGALQLARRIARAHDAPLIAATVSRLLVELNRSAHHPRIFSEVTRRLDAAQKRKILERYYHPYRTRVEHTIRAALRRGSTVWHLSVHSFTPRLAGKVRRADVGLLYDPRRTLEVEICDRWRSLLRAGGPSLRVRRNYPYRGWADGLTTSMRRTFTAGRYAGIELEVNQAFVAGKKKAWRAVSQLIVDSIESIYRAG